MAKDKEKLNIAQGGEPEKEVAVPTGEGLDSEHFGAPLQPPSEDRNEVLPAEDREHGADPSASDVVREEGPVGAPHWQALVDISRILPCEVNPVNSDEWYEVVAVKQDDNSDQYVLITRQGKRLYEREIHDPVLVRTIGRSADLLR